jgi:5'-nucleotidase
MSIGSKTALLDMDGTVCNYDKALLRELARIAGPNDPPYTRPCHDEFLNARRRMIQNQPGFWRNLEPLPLGFEVVFLLEEIGFDIHVLTQGPKKCLNAWHEKVSWCQEHLPSIPITITQDKSLSYGRVLVDDFAPYFLGWLEHRPRGLVVCIAHPWNEMFAKGGTAYNDNVFRYDGTNKDELKKRLVTAYER